MLLEKVEVIQQSNIFHTFYRNQTVITLFTEARNLPYPAPDESSPHPVILLLSDPF
jgi:hypothetical protein